MAKETDRAKAEEVVYDVFAGPGGYHSIGAQTRAELIEAITQALASKDVPEGHIRDDKQVDRKVLGALPLTADGVVIGIDTSGKKEPCECCGAEVESLAVYHPDFPKHRADLRGDYLFIGGTDRKMHTFYSTRESALASSKPELKGKTDGK